MKKLVFFALYFLVIFPVLALADCEFNGKTYDEGTVISGYVCKDGAWVPE